MNPVVILNRGIKLWVYGCDRDRNKPFTKYSQEDLWNRFTNLKATIQSRHI
jgi:hypothetical protein